MENRERLKERQIPLMDLASTKTAGLDPFSADLAPNQSAALRFHVDGNVMITGGAGDLALATARVFLEQGCTSLALLDIAFDSAKTQSAIEWLRLRFSECKILTLACDVTDSESLHEVVEAAGLELGPIRHLAHFAGVVSCHPAMDMTAAEWTRVLNINTTGSFNAAQAVARHIRSHGLGGSIVLISSISALRVNFPQPQVAYNTSKAAVTHMMHCLAAEWAVYGIRVNSVSPGYADTILNEGENLKELRDSWASRNPMGRMALPHEIAGPTVMLCSTSASYINGADLVVDGGASVF